MINPFHLRERLRERVSESADDWPDRYCDNCDGQLTEADLARGECTQCETVLYVDYIMGGESVDEHLWSDDEDDT